MVKCGAVEIVGICDVDVPKLNATADKFGVAAERRYTNMQAMIRETQPELVDIVTPPTIRTRIVEPAIEAGAPAILIEKPIALTPSESRRLVALGQDRLIAVNTQYQWMPHWQRFWTLLESGELGTVRTLRASTRCNILEQGPHILDLALKAARLSGLPAPEWVMASTSGIEYFGSTPVPADTSATIGLGEARLHLNAGPSAPEVPGESVIWYQQQVEVIGDAGRLWVSLNQGWKLWTKRDGFRSGKTGWPKNDTQAQTALFKHLRSVLQGGNWQDFPTRIQVAAHNSDVMFGCYASALGRKRVSLDAPLRDSVVSRLKV
jgi:predicted dehydrogenase